MNGHSNPLVTHGLTHAVDMMDLVQEHLNE